MGESCNVMQVCQGKVRETNTPGDGTNQKNALYCVADNKNEVNKVLESLCLSPALPIVCFDGVACRRNVNLRYTLQLVHFRCCV